MRPIDHLEQYFQQIGCRTYRASPDHSANQKIYMFGVFADNQLPAETIEYVIKLYFLESHFHRKFQLPGSTMYWFVLTGYGTIPRPAPSRHLFP